MGLCPTESPGQAESLIEKVRELELHTAVNALKKVIAIEFYKGILPDNGKHRINFCIEYHDADEKNRVIDRVTYAVYNDDGELDFSGSCENDDLSYGAFYTILKGYADIAGASLNVKKYAKRLTSKTEKANDDMRAAINTFANQYAEFYNLLKGAVTS